MVMNLKQVFEFSGESVDIVYDMDLNDYELFNSNPFVSPVEIRGRVYNAAGVVTISYSVTFRLELSCDRCLTELERDFSYDFKEIIVNEENPENDNYIGALNYELDIDDLVTTDILLSLPHKILCKEDCKGLCFKCGADLNRTTCQCDTKEVDPRLAVLGELLK